MPQNYGTYDSPRSKTINFETVARILKDAGAKQIYVKRLAPNDNSKNQLYFGSHLTDLSFLPAGDIEASHSRSEKTNDSKRKIKYQVSLNLSWFDADGNSFPAPNSKLIYYPQYPEVRFSGFLKRSDVNAGRWMDPYQEGRALGRWLILGASKNSIYAYLVTPEHQLSNELENSHFIKTTTLFWQPDVLGLTIQKSERELLLEKLLEIHNMGWIPSQKLNSSLEPEPYSAPNGGGYTLESLLGIYPNGISEPDYLGWEIKQFGVKKFPTTGVKPTTLMTPEPDDGLYKRSFSEFMRLYGYPDRNNPNDRINFGGKHIVGHAQPLTNLILSLEGFDPENSRILDARGSISLYDDKEFLVAGWSFSKIMSHWKKKHSQAAFIPCMSRKYNNSTEYFYGQNIELGVGTNFELYLSAMYLGFVYYDPGCKIENIHAAKPKQKRRNQFRSNHKNLSSLYKSYESINLLNLN